MPASPPPVVAPLWLWIGFHVVVLGILAFDLGVLNRKSHVVTLKAALMWSAFWIGLSLSFCGLIYGRYGQHKALEFLTGYVVEYALSIDNIFVFILVFGYFAVPKEHQHRVLFWGILGAFLMRGVMIFAGTELMHRFEWIIYFFGAFLVYTGIKLAFGPEGEVDPGSNFAIKLLGRVMPVSQEYDGGKFITLRGARKYATPLLAVLVVVETTDLIFAVDSIPAILAISHDRFIVYTSNICAILGLRSLYFALSGVMDIFHYLKYGLAIVLTFIGVKMLIHHFYVIPIAFSLGVILVVLLGAVLLSLLNRLEQERGAVSLEEKEEE